MNAQLLWLLIGLGTGTMIAAQAPINAELARHLGGAVPAALASFAVGVLALLVMVSATGWGKVTAAESLAAPWWAWVGGVMGAVLVAASAAAVPRIGVTAWVGALIAGQLLASVALDALGAFGTQVRPVNAARMAGVALLLAGTWLVRR